MIDDQVGFGVHADEYAIIGRLSQAKTSDIRDCDYRRRMPNARMSDVTGLQPEVADVFERLDRLGLKQRALAEVLQLAENKISKMRKGERQIRANELVAAREWLDRMESGNPDFLPDLPPAIQSIEYVEVSVLPTFAGAGGGGTGDGANQPGYRRVAIKSDNRNFGLAILPIIA